MTVEISDAIKDMNVFDLFCIHCGSDPLISSTLVRSMPSLSWDNRCRMIDLCSSTAPRSVSVYSSLSSTSSSWLILSVTAQMARIELTINNSPLRSMQSHDDLRLLPVIELCMVPSKNRASTADTVETKLSVGEAGDANDAALFSLQELVNTVRKCLCKLSQP